MFVDIFTLWVGIRIEIHLKNASVFIVGREAEKKVVFGRLNRSKRRASNFLQSSMLISWRVGITIMQKPEDASSSMDGDVQPDSKQAHGANAQVSPKHP